MNGSKRNTRRASRGRSAGPGNRNSRRRRGGSAPPGSSTYRRDSFGRTYGGTIRKLDINNTQEFSKKPRLPLAEADYSTCQMVDAFAISTGIGAGTTNDAPFLNTSVTTPTAWSIAPSLQDLGQVASLTSLFDQYRIDKVEVKIIPQSTSVNVFNTASPNDTVPSLYAVLDFDDSTALASLAAALEYDNVQVVPYGQGLFLTIQPSFTPAIYASGAFSGYAVEKAGWVDCANTAVAHYGMKGIVCGLQTLQTSVVYWNVYAKYFVSFRNTR